MKVFYCPMSQPWSGGGLMVAAPTKEEAIKAFMDNKGLNWLWEKDEDGNYKSDNYPASKWIEIEDLEYKGDKPCVINEDGYAE